MHTHPRLRFSALTLAAAVSLLGTLSIPAQDFSQWAKLVSFRPETALQEKLQAHPVDAAGDRPHLLKIERARGDLVLHSAALVINKMPAVDGKALTVGALARYLRAHLFELADPAKGNFALTDESSKATWESDNPEGVLVKWIDKPSNTESGFFLSDVSGDRWIFSTVQLGKESTAQLMSGNVQISISTAAPLDGCVLQVRGTVRPTGAPTTAEEWLLVERFAGIWIGFLERTRSWVKEHDGNSIPELLPPTVSMVPWSDVAKAFHQPQSPWVGIEGTWASSDREKRFRIEFHGESSCDFIEKNKAGKELRVTCPVTRGEGDKQPSYIIERPNDNEDVLTYYEFKPAVRTAILDKKPEPSKLVMKRNSQGKMIAQWYGLSISRDVYGNLQEIKQPSKGSPRIYEFVPVGD